MNLADLLKKREIERVEPDKVMAQKLLSASENALKAAQDNLKISHADVAISLAYNSMLNAGRALMAKKGFRPISETQHKTVVIFCSTVLSAELSPLVSSFNRMRVRRHDIVYGEIEEGSAGEEEAKEGIGKAGEFLREIKSRI